MAKKKSPAKITIELELTGHPALKREFSKLQKAVNKFHNIQKKLVGSTKKNRTAQKKYQKTIVDTQRKIRNLGKTAEKTAKANDQLAAKFSVFRSKLLLASFGVSLFVGNLVRLAQAAGNVQEDMNKANVVFGDSAVLVQAFADNMESEIGKSRHEIVRFAASVQDILVPLGLMRGFAAQVSQEVVKLAIDVASFNNALDADVMRDFNSAIVGNHETVRKYGIVISDARLKQVAFSEGIIEAGETLTDQQKILARIAILQKDSADAADDAKETFFSFNNQMKAVNTEIENTRVVIGQLLMPVIKAFAIAIRLTLEVVQRFVGIFILAAFEAAKFGVKIVAAKYGISSFSDVVKKGTAANKKFAKSFRTLAKRLIILEGLLFAYNKAREFILNPIDNEKVAENFVTIDSALQKLNARAEKFSKTKIIMNFVDLEQGIEGFETLNKLLTTPDGSVDDYIKSIDDFNVALNVLNQSGEKVFLKLLTDGSMVITKNGDIIANTEDNYKEFIATLIALSKRVKEVRETFKSLSGISEEAFAKSITKAGEEITVLESKLYKVASVGTVMDVWSSGIQEEMFKNQIAFRLFGKEYDDVIGELEQQKDLAIQLGDMDQVDDINLKIKEVNKSIDTIAQKSSEVDLSKIMMSLNAEIRTSVDAQNEYNTMLSKGSQVAMAELEITKRRLELAQQNIFLDDDQLMILIETEKTRDKEVKRLEDIIKKNEMLTQSVEDEVAARARANEIAIMLVDSEAQGSIESRKAHLETLEFLDFSTKMKEKNAELTDKEIEKLYEKNKAEKDATDNLTRLQKSQEYMVTQTEELDKQIELLLASNNLERLQIELKIQNLAIGDKELQQLADKLDKIQRLTDITKLREEFVGQQTEIQALESQLELLQSLNQEEIMMLGGITAYIEAMGNLQAAIDKLKQDKLSDIFDLSEQLEQLQNPAEITAPQIYTDNIGGGFLDALMGGDEESFQAELKTITTQYDNAMSHFASEEQRLNGILQELGSDDSKLSDDQIKKKEETLKALIGLEEEELEFTKTIEEKKREIKEQSFEMMGETFNMFMDMQKSRIQEDLNNELSTLKASESYRKASDKRKQKMEEDVRKKYAKEQIKLFKLDQMSRVASIAMNTADGIMGAAKAYPANTPPGAPWTFMIAAMGAIQAGMVLSQKPPKYQYGGLVGGALHSAGGTMIEAERGEFVMNRNATEAIGLEQLNRMNRTGNAGNNINITLSGNVLSDDFVADEFIPKLEERIRVLSDGTITDRFS